MANVTKAVRLYVSRHRRRRGDSPVQYVYPPFTNVVSGLYQDQATSSVPYDFGNGDVDCPFLFWAVTDPQGGFVQTAPHLSETITGDTTVTAWYAPAGGDGPGGPGVYIDAFDDSVGDFVDDDFVDVISDPTLTASANLDGWLPTAVAEQARAYASLAGHPADPFDQWVVDTTGASAATAELDAQQNAAGYAFANYRQPAPVPIGPPPEGAGSWIDILIGIINDGPGIYIGPDGKIHPWPGPDPVWREVVSSINVYRSAAGMPDSAARLGVQQLAVQGLSDAAAAALKQLQAGGVPTQAAEEERTTAPAR